MKTVFRIISGLALAFALAGCSTIKVGYNALDELGYWWLDGYFDFSNEQSARVQEDLDRLHAWHRARELPRLAELLGRAERLAPGPVTPEQACAFVPDIVVRIQAVIEQAEPLLVTNALGLTPDQLRQLERKQADSNAVWRKDWIELAATEQKEKRYKQVLERMETFYGRLDGAQRSALRATLDRSVFDPQRTYNERVRRQQDLLQVLRKLAGSAASFAEARAALRGYVDRVLTSPDVAHRGYQQALVDEGCRTLAAVHASTTPAQREQAARKLRSYQKDLLELAAAQQ